MTQLDRRDTSIVRLGEHPYGSREYILMAAAARTTAKQRRPRAADADHNDNKDGNAEEPTKEEEQEQDDAVVKVSSLFAHRNILFGARCHLERPPPDDAVPADTTATTHATMMSGNRSLRYLVSNVCLPLVEAALRDAAVEGEQPQALSTLHGLCPWVAAAVAATATEEGEQRTSPAENEEEEEGTAGERLSAVSSDASKILASLRAQDPVAYEAVKAIATGIPRPGHSVVGAGTFRDGARGWEQLAREFVIQQQQRDDGDGDGDGDGGDGEECITSGGTSTTTTNDEYRLYQRAGGELVRIELLADRSPAYLESAGGAMARFFFP